MSALAKTSFIAVGYLAAWLMASAAVSVHAVLTANDSRGADGMYAFGDLLLFVFVFGLVALVPTVAAIDFFRSRRPGNAR